MKLVYRCLLIIQAFSLDVSFGGVIGAWFIASYLGITLDVFVYLIFGSTIWIIYTFDHLMDVRALVEMPLTFRHQIHWKHATTIWGVWSFVFIMILSVLYKMPAITLIAGAILAFLVLIYFISLKLLRGIPVYHKEAIASLVYTTGVFIAPLSNYNSNIGLDIYILFIEFLLLALSNMFIFSIFGILFFNHRTIFRLI